MEKLNREAFEKMVTGHDKEKQEFINKAHEQALNENEERKLTPRQQLQNIVESVSAGEHYNYDKAQEIIERYPELRDDEEAMLSLVSSGRSFAPTLASERLRNDKEFALKAVKRNGRSLHCFSDALRDDEDVVLEAVKQRGLSLEYASERLQDNEKIVMEAVKQDGTLEYASIRLRYRKDVLMEAIKRHISWETFIRMPAEMLLDDDILITAGSDKELINWLRDQETSSNYPGKQEDLNKKRKLLEMIESAVKTKKQ